jgi:hypothetical protein
MLIKKLHGEAHACCNIAFIFNHIFYENCALVNILSRGIFISVFSKESYGGSIGMNIRTMLPYHIQL